MSEPNLSYYQNSDDRIKVGGLLKNLSLYKQYEKLDMKLNNQTKSAACNACESELNVSGASKTNLVKLCHVVCNIMLKLGDIDIFCNQSSCKDLCNHMKFWIYEHLMNITTDINEVNSFYKPLESIRKRDEAKWKICNIKLDMNKDDFKIFKNFYDFLYITKDIIDKISQEYDTDVKLYCTHIKEIVRYYNSIKGSCTDSKCKYHSILEKFKSIFTDESQLDSICNNCKYEKTTCTPGTKVEEEIPCLKDKEYESIHPMQFDDTHNVIGIISRVAIFVIPIFGLLSIFYKVNMFSLSKL